MTSIYFAGQLNQYHVQNYFRKIDHHHFDFKPFGFEVKKYCFLKRIEENNNEEQWKVFKGLP